MKHAQQQPRSTGKTAASSHPFHTGIPDEFEKPSRSYNTTQFHKIAGYTSTTSDILSCRKGRNQPTNQHNQDNSTATRHIIKNCFTQVCNQLKIKSLHSRLQPTHKSSTLQSRHLFTSSTVPVSTTWCYRKLHLII